MTFTGGLFWKTAPHSRASVDAAVVAARRRAPRHIKAGEDRFSPAITIVIPSQLASGWSLLSDDASLIAR